MSEIVILRRSATMSPSCCIRVISRSSEGRDTPKYSAKAAFVLLIYMFLLKNVAISGDAINSIWSIVGYTVLLCFTLFKTGSVARSILGAH